MPRPITVENQSTEEAQQRPVYHFAAPSGTWSNDPNGFSVYDGDIHLFFQWNPDALHWGNMHWGHSVSKDFLTWEELSPALLPEEPYEINGCYSGSAVEQNGRQMLLYTGVDKDLAPSGEYVQQQCLAAGDGRTYTKYDANPVIPASMLPEGYDPAQFRDPLVFRDGDGFAAVLTALDGKGHGRPLLFRSADLVSWTLVGALDGEGGRYQMMIECPDLYEVDGKHILKLSIMDVNRTFGEGVSGAGMDIAEIGTWDGADSFTFERRQPMDEGRDFYASQSMQMPDGRRVVIGWMQVFRNVLRPEGINWQGQMTIPREVHVRDGRLVQNPVHELDQARTNKKEIRDLTVRGKTDLSGVRGRALDIVLHARSADGSPLTISLAEQEKNAIRFTWDPRQGTLTFNRSDAGLPSSVDEDRFAVQTVQLADPGSTLDLRILLDRCSVEAFINGGVQVFTAQYYAPVDADGISLSSDGTVQVDLEAYVIDPQAVNGA